MPLSGSRRAATCVRVLIATALIGCGALPRNAHAEAPPAGPLVLHLAPSARTAALAGAWVAGRDHDVIFYNPAQLVGARPGFDLSVTHQGPSSNTGSIASTYAAGKWSLTLGWGVHILDFHADRHAAYPYAPDIVTASGRSNGFGTLITGGGAILIKGFRIGAAGKFASERVSALPGSDGAASVNQHAVMADLGVARNVLGGVAAAAVQNLGGGASDEPAADEPHIAIPRQILVGWSSTRPVGPLDLGVFTQVLRHDAWNSPSAGVEVGYSWIDGYTVALRAGVRRPDTDAQQPVSFGAGFTVDRFTIEYAAQLFDAGRAAHGVTVRWR